MRLTIAITTHVWSPKSRLPSMSDTMALRPIAGNVSQPWHDRSVLWFWVIVLVALIGAIAVVAAGRGDSMAEVYDDRPDAALPAGRALTADDLRSVRLNTGVRGYRMDEVDALLARLEAELIEREDCDVRLVNVQPAPDQDEGMFDEDEGMFDEDEGEDAFGEHEDAPREDERRDGP